MEYLEKFLKKTGLSSLITSVIFAILGVILIMNPEGTVKFVSYIIGIMFVLVGIYKIATYFIAKGKYDMYNYDIAFGIIAIILGIVTIVYSHQIGTIFRILIGLWIIYSGVIRTSLAFKLKTIESKIWIYSLIIALVMLLCGIYIICSPGAIIVTIGIVILIYSILDIIESVIFLRNIKNIS